MKTIIRLFALGLTVAALTWWLAAGAHRGWTKTSVPKKSVDPVTGLEAIEYEKRFVPGLDFVGAALLGAGALAGVSLLRTKRQYDMHQNSNLLKLLALSLASTLTFAAPQTFDFKDPKGVNNVVFNLDAPLEAITGSANGITGTVSYDPAQPAATKGKIVIASSSLHVPNPMMKGHMTGEQWMDVAKYPEISFETKQLKNVKTSGDNTTADAVGTLTLRGVAKDLTVPVKITYLKDKLSQRVPNQKGDLLVLRSNFSIKRSDFGINPKAPEDKVSDTIDLTLSIAGSSPR